MNDCTSCDHRKHSAVGHCYMFRTEPAFKCMQHTSLPKQKPNLPVAIMMTILGTKK